MKIKTKISNERTRGYRSIADFELPEGEERGTCEDHISLAEAVMVACRFEMLTKAEIKHIHDVIDGSLERCVFCNDEYNMEGELWTD